jgi:hypothetical protein
MFVDELVDGRTEDTAEVMKLDTLLQASNVIRRISKPGE